MPPGVHGCVLIGRAQLDYHLTPAKNHHIMMSAGIFEDMFSGAGMEYLFFKPRSLKFFNYEFGNTGLISGKKFSNSYPTFNKISSLYFLVIN